MKEVKFCSITLLLLTFCFWPSKLFAQNNELYYLESAYKSYMEYMQNPDIPKIPIESRIDYPKDSDTIFVNCGGEALKDIFGNQYNTDQEYTSENGGGYIAEIYQPNWHEYQDNFYSGWEFFPSLYRDQLFGIQEYKFDINDGLYSLCLQFSENEHFLPGKRVMNIYVEDELVLENFDIFALAERGYAVLPRILADVKDQQLNIRFEAVKGKTSIAALRIVKIDDPETTPPVVEWPKIINGFNEAILDWQITDFNTYAGYNIYKKVNGEFKKLNVDPWPMSFYVDRNLKAGSEQSYIIKTVDFWGRESDPSEELTCKIASKEDSKLRVVEVEIDQDTLNSLFEDLYSDKLVNVSVKCEGKNWNSVKLRLRGNSTRVMRKTGLKLVFPEDDLFFGEKKLNLVSMAIEPGLLMNKTVYNIRKMAGVITQDTYPVHLRINGQFKGVFLHKEQEDKFFLKKRDMNNSDVYRAVHSNFDKMDDPEDYKIGWEKETNEEEDWNKLIELTEFIHDEENDFHKDLYKNLNIKHYAKAMAAINFVDDPDQCVHNYLMIYSYSDSIWNLVQYDHDLSFYDPYAPIDLGTKNNLAMGVCYYRLFNRYYENEDLKYFYISQYLKLINEKWHLDKISKDIDKWNELIKFDAERDIYKLFAEKNYYFNRRPTDLKEWFTKRIDFLKEELEKIIPENYDPHSDIMINEIQTNNINTIKDNKGINSDWIELYSNGTFPVDINGLTFKFVNNDKEWTLNHSHILGPDEHYLLWFTDDPNATGNYSTFLLPDEDLVELYSIQNKLIDELDYSEINPDMSYARVKDADENWEITMTPTPKRSNELKSLVHYVQINEIMSANSSGMSDEHGEYDDWVEIYNPMDKKVDISGYYLTDNIEKKDKWSLPDSTIINAKSHLLVWCDDQEEQGKYHTNFKLSKEGESLALCASDISILIDSVSYPRTGSNDSWGRHGDGSDEWVEYQQATPGSSNYILPDENEFKIENLYPNPFATTLNIVYSNGSKEEIEIWIHDLSGKEIERIKIGEKSIGLHTYEWTPQKRSSSVLIITLVVDELYKDSKLIMYNPNDNK